MAQSPTLRRLLFYAATCMVWWLEALGAGIGGCTGASSMCLVVPTPLIRRWRLNNRGTFRIILKLKPNPAPATIVALSLSPNRAFGLFVH